MKNCNLTLAESGRQYNLAINPGTTPREIKQELALPASYQIGTPNKIFQDDEHIIEEIHDGEQLYASTPVVVGWGDDDDGDDEVQEDDDEDDDKKDSLSSFLKNIIGGLAPIPIKLRIFEYPITNTEYPIPKFISVLHRLEIESWILGVHFSFLLFLSACRPAQMSVPQYVL